MFDTALYDVEYCDFEGAAAARTERRRAGSHGVAGIAIVALIVGFGRATPTASGVVGAYRHVSLPSCRTHTVSSGH